jgi:hypothetical protein
MNRGEVYMGNLRVAKMLLKNSEKTDGKHKGQDLIDVREAVKCIVSYLEKREKASKDKARGLKGTSLKRSVKIWAPVVLSLLQVSGGVKNLLPSRPQRVTIASATISERVAVRAMAIATVQRRGVPKSQ